MITSGGAADRARSADQNRPRGWSLTTAALVFLFLLTWFVHRLMTPLSAAELPQLAAEVQAGARVLKSLRQLEEPLQTTLSEQLEPAQTRLLLRELFEDLLQHPDIDKLRYSWRPASDPLHTAMPVMSVADRQALLLMREIPSLSISEAKALLQSMRSDWYRSTLQLQLSLGSESAVPDVLQQLLRLPAVAVQTDTCALSHTRSAESERRESESSVEFECLLQLQQLLPTDSLQRWLNNRGSDGPEIQVELKSLQSVVAGAESIGLRTGIHELELFATARLMDGTPLQVSRPPTVIISHPDDSSASTRATGVPPTNLKPEATVVSMASGEGRKHAQSDGVAGGGAFDQRFQGFIAVGDVLHVLIGNQSETVSRRRQPDSALLLSLRGRQLIAALNASPAVGTAGTDAGIGGGGLPPPGGSAHPQADSVWPLSGRGMRTGDMNPPLELPAREANTYRLIPGQPLSARLSQLLEANVPIAEVDLAHPAHHEIRLR